MQNWWMNAIYWDSDESQFSPLAPFRQPWKTDKREKRDPHSVGQRWRFFTKHEKRKNVKIGTQVRLNNL